MLLKSIWCPVFALCSATADSSSWSRHMCLICSLHLVSMDLVSNNEDASQPEG
jgi:hypothetical protein